MKRSTRGPRPRKRWAAKKDAAEVDFRDKRQPGVKVDSDQWSVNNGLPTVVKLSRRPTWFMAVILTGWALLPAELGLGWASRL
jgi:hypothetical protein